MLILLRHGRTEANRVRLLQGRADHPLDAEGEKQARDAAEHLRSSVPGGIHRVISSPLVRARDTAAALGLPVEIDHRLVEVSYGDWEDRPIEDVPAEVWRQWRSDLDFRPPNGESLGELGVRVRSLLDECAAFAEENPGVNTVLVAHVSPIKAALAWGLGVSDLVGSRIYVAQASICRLAVRQGHPVVLSVNEVSPSGSG